MNKKIITDMIEKRLNNQEKLLYTFCKHLICINKLDIPDYNIVLYETGVRATTYSQDVDYLIDYQQKHGYYPPKFQQLFNEWLLMRM